MKMNDILERLNSAAELYFQQFISSWKNAHAKKVRRCLDVLKDFLERVQKISLNTVEPAKFWHELETTINQYLKLTESFSTIYDSIPAEGLWDSWKKQFSELLTDVPKSMTIPLTEKYWQAESEDSIKIRLWKWLKRKQIGIKFQLFKIMNRVRSILKRPAVSFRLPKRKILLHEFFNSYHVLPFAKLLFQEWQRNLQKEAATLHQLHEEILTILGKLLFLDDFKSFCKNPDSQKISSRLKETLQKHNALNTLLDNLDNSKRRAIENLRTNLEKMNNSIWKQWQYSGTSVFSERRMGQKTISDRWKKLEEELDRDKRAWVRHFEGEKKEWQKSLMLSLLQIQTGQLCVETANDMSRRINSQIIPAFNECLEMISASLEKFKEISTEKEKNFQKALLSEKKIMLIPLRQEKLPHIMDTLDKVQLDKCLINYLSKIRNAVEMLPVQTYIFRHRDLHGLPPDSKIIEIPLKKIVLEELYPILVKKHAILSDDLQRRSEGIHRNISEIDQVVEFDLEQAMDLLEKSKDPEATFEAKKVVTEGLERTVNQLGDLIQQNRDIDELIWGSLLNITLFLENQLFELRDNEKIIQLKIRLVRAKIKGKIQRLFSRVLKGVRTAFPYLLKFLKVIFKKVRSSYFRIRKITGLEPVTPEVKDKLLFLVTETKKKIERLPYVYQQLFKIEPLEDKRFFAGREEDLAHLKREFAAWEGGQFGITSLVGEKGSGKTTLINFAMREIYRNLPIIKIDLAGHTIFKEEALLMHLASALKKEESSSLDDLESKILAQTQRKVIIVEDLQNLFLRTVDGFDALEKLLLFVSRTHKKIYWLLSCTLYSWQYLDKVIHISRFFQRTLLLTRIPKREIEKIILNRHRISGYQLQFDVIEEISRSKKFKKLTSHEMRQDFLKDYFFEQLQELAAGNISVTIMFWLSAIKEITKKELVISPKIDLDYTFLDRLPAEDLFTLATLIQHEILTSEEHALVFHQNHQKSLLLLNRMCNRGILVETPKGYKVHPFLYRPIVETLKTKNLFH